MYVERLLRSGQSVWTSCKGDQQLLGESSAATSNWRMIRQWDCINLPPTLAVEHQGLLPQRY